MKDNVAKSAIWLMGLTIIAKIIGLFREVAFSYAFGTSSISDAYIVGTSFASIIFIATAGAFTTAYIPLGAGLDKKNLSEFSSNILNLGFIVITIISLLFIIFTKPILLIFASGFRGDTLNNAIIISRFAAVSSIFLFFLNIGNGYLNLQNRFFSDPMQSIIVNIILSISFFLSGGSAWLLGSFYWISLFIAALIIAFILKKKDFIYHFLLQVKDDKISRVIKMTGPIFLGLVAIQINGMIDSSFASTLGEGTVSALKYALLLCSFIAAIFGGSISSVLYPKLSRFHNQSNNMEIKNTIIYTLKILTIIMMPIVLISVFKSYEIVTIIFKRGAFNINSTYMTAKAMSIYSIGLLAMAFNEIFNRLFYSIQISKIPAKCYIFGMLSNVLMDWLFIKKWNYEGLAMATSLSYIFMIIIYIIEFRKNFGSVNQFDIFKTLIRIAIGSFVMYFSMKIFSEIIIINSDNIFFNIISLVINSVLSIFLYIIALILMRTPEIIALLSKFHKTENTV